MGRTGRRRDGLPARVPGRPVAVAAQDRLETLAAALGQDTPVPVEGLVRPALPGAPEDAEGRSVGELRADVLADLLLGGVPPDEPGFPAGIRARVSVTVPIGLLTGTTTRTGGAGTTTRTGSAGTGPGTGLGMCGAAVLSGYGPISTEVARQLAAGAGAWHRVLTHPATGVVLDHDRTVYAVPAGLRRLVQSRDGTCRFPGCRRRAEACEIDHTVAWAEGGTTAEANLAALCRAHHRIKHRDGPLGRWTVRRVPDPPHDAAGARDGAVAAAVLEWTSPAGLVHRTIPEHHHPGLAPEPDGVLIDTPAEQPPPAPPTDHPPPDDPSHDPAPF